MELIDSAHSENVILLCLPAHETHTLQPLDVAVFKSLKVGDFVQIVKEPFEMAFSISDIESIYPEERHAIQSSKVFPSEIHRSLSESETDKAASDISTISTSSHV